MAVSGSKMPCYEPVAAYRSKHLNPSGKRSLVARLQDAHSPRRVIRPCGQCVGCRLDHSYEMAVRCFHEQQAYVHNSFVTLTYDEDHLPEGGSLCRRDVQLFMKRLRKRFGPAIRAYGCGEYGDVTARPHYHLILFNHHFPDRKIFSGRNSEHPIFVSAELDRCWSDRTGQIGLAVIGEVTFDSIAYCARYCVKKVTGKKADQHYSRLDADGRYYRLLPEFSVVSNGIGSRWFHDHAHEAYVNDSCIVNGRPVPLPRYYDTRFELTNKLWFKYVQRQRRLRARLRSADNTNYRLQDRLVIAKARLAQKRGSI